MFKKSSRYSKMPIVPILGWLGFCGLFFAAGLGHAAETSQGAVQNQVDLDQAVMDEGMSGGLDVSFKEQQIIRINQSLKNAVEENEQLMKENQKMASDLKQLNGQKAVDANRLTTALSEKEDLGRKLEDIARTKDDQDAQIKKLQAAVDQKDAEWQAKYKKLEEQLTLEEKWHKEMEAMKAPAEAATTIDVNNPEEVQGVVSKVSELNNENDRLKKDSAKVHYNMGNVFFQQGDYQKAAWEYSQAVEIMPFDAASHYNLAFVSGEYLSDQKTALKHYQQYLYLNPSADDAAFVKDKINKARMELKSSIDSPLDKAEDKEQLKNAKYDY